MSFFWKLQAFDTDILGFLTAKIEKLDSKNARGVKDLISDLKKNHVAYATFRFPSSDFILIHALETNGFLLVDGIIALQASIDKESYKIDEHIKIAEEKDARGLIQLSGSVFYLNRFYNDPFIPKEKANLIYKKWMENSIKEKAADAILIWEEAGNVVGFITIEDSGHIPLIGVSEKMRGKGIAKKLTIAALNYLQKNGVKKAIIETQIANVPAQRAYLSCGFKPIETFFTFRWINK